jgi:hypothetical protein
MFTADASSIGSLCDMFLAENHAVITLVENVGHSWLSGFGG